jgi:hypothetical protein
MDTMLNHPLRATLFGGGVILGLVCNVLLDRTAIMIPVVTLTLRFIVSGQSNLRWIGWILALLIGLSFLVDRRYHSSNTLGMIVSFSAVVMMTAAVIHFFVRSNPSDLTPQTEKSESEQAGA